MTPPRGVAPAEAAELEREYIFHRELGRGGTAVVYLATDRELGRPVAIKLIQGSLGADEETLRRFTVEARTAAMMHHPSIVAVHAVKRLRNGTLAMVLQYVPGGTLKALIRREAPLPIPFVQRVLRDIGSALEYAHRRGIVHRDVKPENIFLDSDGTTALLADFGIARTADAASTQTLSGVVVGTPAYMSPEQIDGVRVDGRSDLYSLALVAWEMLTGEAPWEGESLYGIIHKQKWESLPPLHRFRDDVPVELEQCLAVCLNKRPADRFAGVGELLAALEQAKRRDPWSRWKRWRAARRLRRAAILPASVPEVPLADVLELAAASPPASEATVQFRRPPPASPTSEPAPLVPADLPRPVAETAEPGPSLVVSGATSEAEASDVGAPSVAEATDGAVGGRIRSPSVTRILRMAAGAGGLLLVTGLGATLFAITGGSGPAARAESPSLREVGTAIRTADDDIPRTPALSAPAWGAPARGRVFGFAEPLQMPATGWERLFRAAPAIPAPRAAAPEEATAVAEPEPVEVEVASDSVSAENGAAAPAAAAPPERPSASAGSTARSLLAVSLGGLHTCVVTGSGEALCWGGNGEGQAGRSGGSRVVVPFAVSGGGFREIAAGVAHTCGLLASGEAVCWGSNRGGQLGDGSTASRAVPGAVAGSHRFTALAAARAHTCGLTRGGELFCWGANEDGMLGTGNAEPGLVPVRAGAGVYSRFALGWSHTCALNGRGQAFCWGSNADGQLGTGGAESSPSPRPVTVSQRLTQVVAGAAHTCALAAGGGAFCWGRNSNGQLGDGSTTARRSPVRVASEVSFTALAAGTTHTCGITRSGEALCWGRNVYGQLGDGTSTDRPVPAPVDTRVRFTSIHASGAHTCGVTAAGEQFCWGYNVEGQLGDGTRAHRLRPVSPAAPAR
jgi:serine/threonine protein kinase/alpha-tubulin suppressor-like RCC1 family protein